MIAGIKLSSSEEKISGVAFIDKKVSSYSLKEDKEILELIKRKDPEIVVFTVKLTSPERDEEYREGEEELIDEGYSPAPYGIQDTRILQERAKSLRSKLRDSEIDFIECDPEISCDILEISGDVDLETYGLNTNNIDNVYEFEAVIAALTGLFYERNDFEDHDIIIPNLKEE